MNKPELLFDPKQFAAAFATATGNASPALRESPGAIVWLEHAARCACERFASGDGEIVYQGTKHAFTIWGLSTADVPAPRISATGIVKRLRTLLDFAGNYSSEGVESRLTSGDSVTYLKNERGVLIQLVARHAGLRFGVSANGVQIRFKHHYDVCQF
jgi:hypothetical protein